MPTRPTWAEISLPALRNNYRVLAGHAAPHAEVLAVVKADAYGHGAVLCARAIVEERERRDGDGARQWFGVTCLEEALPLRGAGLRNPILLMSGLYGTEAEAVLEHGLTPAVWEPFHLDWLEQAARLRQAGPRSVPVHLMLDTGMAREGVALDRLDALLQRFTANSPLRLEGVHSHLASAEVADAPDVDRQTSAFRAALARVAAHGLRPGFVHLANSAALAVHPEGWQPEPGAPAAARILVRPGLALYGYTLPCTTADSALVDGPAWPLEPVLRWKTRIISLREVPAGQPVGYNGMFVAARPSRLALLPVGYADGLNRRLSNRARVLVRGQCAPLAGRISMDLATIDVTDVPHVQPGDEVLLLGSDGGCRIDAWDHAHLAGTIPYEILCNISKRVPRIAVEA